MRIPNPPAISPPLGLKGFGLFGKNVVADAVGTVFGIGAQLLLLVYLAHHLTTSGYAKYILANAAIAVGEMFSDFGARMWAIRQYALGVQLKTLLKPVLLTKSFYTAIFFAFLTASNFGEFSPLDIIVIAGIAFLQPSSDPFLWFFRGRERLYKDAAVTLSWRLLSVVLMLGLAANGFGATYLLIGWLLASMIRVGGEFLFFFRGIESWPDDLAAKSTLEPIPLTTLISLVFPIGCAFVLMSLYQRVGIFALQRISDQVSVATYGSALSLVGVSGFLAISISTAFFPSLSRSLHNHDIASATRTFRLALQIIAVVFAAVGIGGVALAPWIFDAIVPVELRGGAVVMQILLPGLYISSLSVMLKYCLNALSLNFLDAMATVLGIAIFLAALILPKWTTPAYGAAIAWNAGELAIYGARLFALWRNGRLGVRAPLLLSAVYVALVGICLVVANGTAPFHAKYPLLRILHS